MKLMTNMRVMYRKMVMNIMARDMVKVPGDRFIISQKFPSAIIS